MATIYTRDDAAKRMEELAAEAEVPMAELLSTLVWHFGEQGRDLARENRLAREEMERRQLGPQVEATTVPDGKGCGYLGCGSQDRTPCPGCRRTGMRGTGKRFVPGETPQEGRAA